MVDSLQSGDQPDYEGLFDLFPQNYHEPYYAGYATENFGTMAKAHGLTHIRDVKAFVSKLIVFDKPIGGGGHKRTTRDRFEKHAGQKNAIGENGKPRPKLRRQVW